MNLENKPTEASRKKRFYIVLALFLAAAGTASYFSAKRTTDIAKENITTQTEAITQIINPSQLVETEVNQNVEGIPDERYQTQTLAETQPEIVRAEAFSLPLGTTIIKSFSYGELVKSNTMNDWRVHNGVDFKGTTGDAVKAINNGVVTRVYDDALWGTVVVVDHGDKMTARYCGLGKGSTVSQGDTVKINDKIGNLGEIPIESADSPHLHLEIIQDGTYVDPITAMNVPPESFFTE